MATDSNDKMIEINQRLNTDVQAYIDAKEKHAVLRQQANAAETVASNLQITAQKTLDEYLQSLSSNSLVPSRK